MNQELPDLKAFAWKTAFLSIPFIMIILSYVWLDPFQVIYPRDNYYVHCHVEPNRDFVTFEMFLKNIKKYRYDSYIFGNSRSLSFQCKEWEQYLGDSASAYHFDASGESLYGVWAKLKFLDKNGYPIRHVLWVVDSELLSLLNKSAHEKGHLYLKHPALSGMSWPEFQLRMSADYFKQFFFIKYLDHHFFHQHRSYMRDSINERVIKYDRVRNDRIRNPRDESEVKPDRYYKAQWEAFYWTRKTHQADPAKTVVGREQMTYLNEIRDIFKKHGTDVRILISPLYDQVPFHGRDLAVLKELFGEDTVHDYSGTNEFTKDVRNYHDHSHYKKKVADQILKQVYSYELFEKMDPT